MTAEKHACCVRVYSGARHDFRGHLCQKSANVERDGKWYCGIHDPVKVAEKRAADEAQYEKERTSRQRAWALSGAAPAMLAALENLLAAYDDMRGLSNREGWDAARAAVAKAKGETK